MSKWGLLGTWAAECDLPASRGNPYLAYLAGAGGRMIQRHDIGETHDDSPVVAATIDRDGLLSLRLHDAGSTGTRSLVLIKAASGVVRILGERAADGSSVVKDGTATATGAATFWLSRCY